MVIRGVENVAVLIHGVQKFAVLIQVVKKSCRVNIRRLKSRCVYTGRSKSCVYTGRSKIRCAYIGR